MNLVVWGRERGAPGTGGFRPRTRQGPVPQLHSLKSGLQSIAWAVLTVLQIVFLSGVLLGTWNPVFLFMGVAGVV